MVSAEIDNPLIALSLSRVIADGDGILTLNDPTETVEVWSSPRHAPVTETLVLWTVVPVHAPRVVERSHIETARRWRAILAVDTATCANAAGFRVAQEHEAPCAFEGDTLFCLVGQGRKLAGRRIHDE